MGQKILRDPIAQCLRVGGTSNALCAQQSRAVGRGDETPHLEFAAAEFGETAQRHLATAGQGTAHCALGQNAGRSVGMVQRRKHANEVRAVSPALDSQCALPDRGQAVGAVQDGADALAEAQAFQAGGGQNDRRVLSFVQLAQPRLHIATQWFDFEMREARTQLAFAPQTGGADDRSRGEVLQRRIIVGDKCIARIFTLADACKHESVGQIHRHILQRMDGDVGAAGLERGFQLLYE